MERLTLRSESAVRDFCAHCTEDEVDTLDLDLESDNAFGFFDEGQLVGIGRSAPITTTSLSDLTVLVRPDFRNRGIASSLVTQLLLCVGADGAVPKYRVSTSNRASQTVAERLGLVPLSRLTVFTKG
jgi:predicted GNAT family acetyltransferase